MISEKLRYKPYVESIKPNGIVVGIDRDGIINQDLGRCCTNINEFNPIPGSLEAIASIRQKGYNIVIITNQGGIERGEMTSFDVDSIHEHMLGLLGNAGCPSIDGIYYSESSNKKDYYAKPNVGMFKKCQEDNPKIKFNKGFYIGDKISDLKAAIKIGARPVLIRTGYGLETEKKLNKYTYREIKKRTYVFDSLTDFANEL